MRRLLAQLSAAARATSPALADGVSPEIERLVGVAQAVLSQESTAR